MWGQALGKIAQTLVVLFVVSVASFGLLKLAPGDPIQIMLGSEFSQEAYDSLTAELGLDQPFLAQYADWAVRFVQGDWGTSYVARTDIFTYAFKEALPVTLTLASFSLAFCALRIFSSCATSSLNCFHNSVAMTCTGSCARL